MTQTGQLRPLDNARAPRDLALLSRLPVTHLAVEGGRYEISRSLRNCPSNVFQRIESVNPGNMNKRHVDALLRFLPKTLKELRLEPVSLTDWNVNDLVTFKSLRSLKLEADCHFPLLVNPNTNIHPPGCWTSLHSLSIGAIDNEYQLGSFRMAAHLCTSFSMSANQKVPAVLALAMILHFRPTVVIVAVDCAKCLPHYDAPAAFQRYPVDGNSLQHLQSVSMDSRVMCGAMCAPLLKHLTFSRIDKDHLLVAYSMNRLLYLSDESLLQCLCSGKPLNDECVRDLIKQHLSGIVRQNFDLISRNHIWPEFMLDEDEMDKDPILIQPQTIVPRFKHDPSNTARQRYFSDLYVLLGSESSDVARLQQWDASNYTNCCRAANMPLLPNNKGTSNKQKKRKANAITNVYPNQ